MNPPSQQLLHIHTHRIHLAEVSTRWSSMLHTQSNMIEMMMDHEMMYKRLFDDVKEDEDEGERDTYSVSSDMRTSYDTTKHVHTSTHDTLHIGCV